MSPRNPWIRRLLASSAGVAMLAVILVAINVVAGYFPGRLDVTDEGVYTLSEGSKNIVAGLPDPVTIKYYFTEDLANIPVGIKNYARKVVELLEEYEVAGNGNLSLEVYDPKPDSDEEAWARKYGLHRVNLPDGTNLLFGLVAVQEEREVALPFFDPRRESMLEYEISQTITRVTEKKKATLGVLAYMKISGEQPTVPGQPGKPPWAIVNELRKTYTIENIFPSTTEIPAHIETMLVVHPKFPPDHLAYAIDQFILRGGRLMMFTDPNARMDAEEMRRTGIRMNYSNFPKLFEAWGITFDKTKVIGDQDLATRVNTQTQGIVDFPLWITFRGTYLSDDSMITNQLEEVTLIDGAEFIFEAKEGSDLAFQPLLTTSTAAGTIDSVMAQMAGPLDVARALKPDGKPRIMAGLLTGTFHSAFPDGPPEAQGVDVAGETMQRLKANHLSVGERPSSVLLVGDSDFMADHFSVQRVNMFGYAMFQPINDNLNFVLNSVEFLSGNQELINIRSRGTFSRPFTRVLSLQRAAQEKYQSEESLLSTKLEDVRKRLGELEAKGTGATGQQVLLTLEMVEEVNRFREEERRTRQELREVRKILRQDIETLGSVMLTLNLLLLPLLVAIAGFVGHFRRTRKHGGRN